MAIEKLSQFELGMYQEALQAKSADGKRAYFSFGDYLESQARAGAISESLITADREEQIKRYGKVLSPVRQAMFNSGITFLGKHSSPMAVFFPNRGAASGNPDYVPGAETLFPALVQEVFEAAIEGGPLLAEVAQGGFVTSPTSPTNLLYRQVSLDRITDEQINDLNNPNLLRLADLVALNTGIDSDSYRGMVIEDTDLGYYEFGRVAEYGEIPLYTLRIADRAINIYKRGGGIMASYEVLRRQTINQFARVVMLFGLARQLQLIKDALVIGLNGDGNPNSGANDTPGAFAPTIRNWDEYAIDLAYAYTKAPNIAAADNTEIKNIRALRYPQANLGMTPTQVEMYGNFQTPGGQTLRIAPAGSVLEATRKTLFWNIADGLEQVTENGSYVQEAERFILTQHQVFTMTYNTGFSKPMKNSFFTYTRAAA